jgi:hypothetical protein
MASVVVFGCARSVLKQARDATCIEGNPQELHVLNHRPQIASAFDRPFQHDFKHGAGSRIRTAPLRAKKISDGTDRRDDRHRGNDRFQVLWRAAAPWGLQTGLL